MRFYRRSEGAAWSVDFWHNGQRFRLSTGTPDRKEAQEWADKRKHELWREDRLGERPAVSWDAAVLDWLAKHQHLASLSDRKDQLRWASVYLKGVPIDKIDRNELDRLGDIKGREISKRTKRRVAPATVNRLLAAISGVLGHAAKRGLLAAKPPIPKRQEPKTKVIWATEAQAEKLLAKLPDHLAAMARFTLAAGPRQYNVTHLEWSRVDLERRIAWAEADDAKAGKVLTIHLNDEAIAVLKAQKGKHRRWVFPYRSQPIDNPAQVAYKAAVKAAGLPKAFDWHALRHTWASWHIQRGTLPSVLMELGGWSSLAMVEKYAHLAPSHLAAAAGNSGLARKRAHRRKSKQQEKRVA